jgi:hypothetical protein
MAEANPAFTERLRNFLRERGLNPYSAARLTGRRVSTSTIQLWTEGQRPSMETVLRFLSAFPDENPEDWLSLLENRWLGRVT